MFVHVFVDMLTFFLNQVHIITQNKYMQYFHEHSLIIINYHEICFTQISILDILI